MTELEKDMQEAAKEVERLETLAWDANLKTKLYAFLSRPSAPYLNNGGTPLFIHHQTNILFRYKGKDYEATLAFDSWDGKPNMENTTFREIRL